MADKIPTLFERTASSHYNSRDQQRIFIPMESDIEECTSQWTRNTLNTLDIDSILTKSFDPMDLISFAFSVNDPKILSRVERCKTAIAKHSIIGFDTHCNVLDADEVENIEPCAAFEMMVADFRNRHCYDISKWNIQPPHCDDKLDIQLYQKFQVHGELFAQQLINISMMKKSQDITEGMYQSLFQKFAAMFGLTSLSSSVLGAAQINIGNTTVTSLPDVIFPDVSHTDKDDDRLKLLAVCKVTKDFTRREELFPVEQGNNRKRIRRKEEEKVIQHLDEALQEQHGGELLVQLPLSEHNGLLGIIVQKTHITFSYFQCNKIQFEVVKSRDHYINKPVIYYSRPYNYLKAADREELIRPLLTLGFIQYSPCCISRKDPYIKTVEK
ncbi:uncharacterized protein LOC127718196 isoform X2 [Mytilus californianus]|uniref:uncharacterized protein LOC127718196 isoform X2 n=2 Tax=Mytilus californianus TaxID=6549 RepID=UPI0022451613|nr:uncharacterized protein LOC127718196 isoform X2 [Mytilus californianus]